MKRRILLTFVISALLLAGVRPGWAQRGGLSLIRDAEIEHTIARFSKPVFEAAGLDSRGVRVHLVNDSQLNAFVAGGQRIFLYTGLLLRVETPNQLIAVIAHETGHISGGHLARTHDALRNASITSILALIVGAAAIAAGGGQAAGPIIYNTQVMAQQQFLAYSRVQEAAADQAALTFLERTGQSGRGMVEFLEIIGNPEVLAGSRPDTYARSHPVGRDRIGALDKRVEESPFRDHADAPEDVAALRRLQAKLHGFLKTKAQTLRRYPPSDRSVAARYARAIAYYRVPELRPALAELDSLIAEAPDDPYFHELKGQILFENGRIRQSIAPSETALRLRPHSSLLRFGLARALVSSEDPAMNRTAIRHLEDVVRRDPEMGGAWGQLAIAYGRDGRMGDSALASAERFFLIGDMRGASQQAQRARQKLPEGSPSWLRASDIEHAVKKQGNRG